MPSPPPPSESALQGRYELKLPLPASSEAEVRLVLRLHPAAFRPIYHPRLVNNLYFDTHDWESLGDHRAGLSRRVKLRLRWYGPTWLADPAQGARFELKWKENWLGFKLVVAPVEVLDLEQLDWSGLARRLRAQPWHNLLPWARHAPQPVLINRYRREYLRSADGKVRVTLDRELELYPQQWGTRPDLRRRSRQTPERVLEFKADREDHDRLKEVLDALPWRTAACSKYAHGMLGLDPTF